MSMCAACTAADELTCEDGKLDGKLDGAIVVTQRFGGEDTWLVTETTGGCVGGVGEGTSMFDPATATEVWQGQIVPAQP